MGNFSRNTYDPAKGYVGVRLQQGVPLVDADWNELNDVVRHELYDGLGQLVGDGVEAGSSSFQVTVISPPGPPTSQVLIHVQLGIALVRGRPVRLYAPILYHTQRWVNPAVATADEVDPIVPPVLALSPFQNTLVYLDVWEREVGSAEDPDLINSDIGIETAVRTKREATVRLVVGGLDLPSAPPGHAFMPLARLWPIMMVGSGTYLMQVHDVRPVRRGIRGTSEVSFPPVFQPVSFYGGPQDPWSTVAYSSIAFKYTSSEAWGTLPLSLPQGSRLRRWRLIGYTETTVDFILIRARPVYPFEYFTDPDWEAVAAESISPAGSASSRTFDEDLDVDDTDDRNLIDNNRYHYSLLAGSNRTDGYVEISGIGLTYRI